MEEKKSQIFSLPFHNHRVKRDSPENDFSWLLVLRRSMDYLSKIK